MPELAPAQTYVQRIIEHSAGDRLPELFGDDACPAIYRHGDRRGVGVTVVRTTDLAREQLIAVLRFRLAQYVAIGFVDPELVFSKDWEYEPLEHVHDNDVHVIAGHARTGEILCYLTIHALPEAAPHSTLRDRERPLWPVEAIHGWGVFNHLRILPDLPLARVREFKRFVRSHALDPRDELVVRAPIEVGLALFWALTGPLRAEIDAIVGDYEQRRAKRNLDYFHVPQAVVYPADQRTGSSDEQFGYSHERRLMPFAFWVPDLLSALVRARTVECALEQPGVGALLRLVERDYARSIPPSSFLVGAPD